AGARGPRARGRARGVRRSLGPRGLGGFPLRDARADLGDDLGRDLVHAVPLARVHEHLPQDLVLGIALEALVATGDQDAAPEFLQHPLLIWLKANPGRVRRGRPSPPARPPRYRLIRIRLLAAVCSPTARTRKT